MQRRRLAYALLICSVLLFINAVAVVTGYADEVYCSLQIDCRDQYTNKEIHTQGDQYATTSTYPTLEAN